MVFSDLFFLFAFLPIFAIAYLLATHIDRRASQLFTQSSSLTARNLTLVLFSLLFYAWGEPVYVFVMIASALVNYWVGRVVGNESGRARGYLILGIVYNLLVLFVFKYLSFFAAQFSLLKFDVPDINIALPIGISFYTFQSISYLVDVYRGVSPSQRSFLNMLLYISMFPQLIAGPIVRYGTVASEIEDRHVDWSDLSEGIMRFQQGLGKKVILANQLSEVSSLLLGSVGLAPLSVSGAWIGIVAFTLQIYFDFSGYSDMAIGIGRCLGFHFNENFNHPYCSRSITEFWRRWHISLGSFFRDYVYIPIGGNRRHKALNILVVWMLTGFWHGASWNYLIWGLYFGIIVMLEKYTLLRIIHRVPSIFLYGYSLLLVIVGWGIFYFEDFSAMIVFFRSLLARGAEYTDFTSLNALTSHGWLWVIAIFFCLPLPKPKTLLFRLVWAILLIVFSVALLVGATNNAFLYTRF